MSEHNTALLYQLLTKQEHNHLFLIGLIMTQMQTLAADVAALTSASQSAVSLLAGLHDQLTSARQAVANGDGGEALTAVIHDIEMNTAALANAVTANTAAQAEPVVVAAAVVEPVAAAPAVAAENPPATL